MVNTDKVSIVFEDDEIIAFYRQGSSDFLLVTFGDLITLANGMRFYADAPAIKANLSCLAFVAKRGNWYPRGNMEAAIAATQYCRDKYTCVVGYGTSMGGHGIIKYSKKLGCTHTIAMCPQWSIDPVEFPEIDPGWQYLLGPIHTGMGIRGNEIGGTIALFYDPFCWLDVFHAKKIAALGGTTLVAVPRAGHSVSVIFAGTNTLLNLVAAVRRHDIKYLRRASRQKRRHSRLRIDRIMLYLADRSERFKSKPILYLLRRGLVRHSGYKPTFSDRLLSVLRPAEFQHHRRKAV